MAKLTTASFYSVNAPRNITAVVPGIGTWQKIATLAGSDLPDQGAGKEYVFTAWCDVGDMIPTANVNTAIAQVALGNQNAPFDQYARAYLRWPGFKRQTKRFHGVPFFFVRGYLTADRGTWNTANDICLWAWINPGADPPSQVNGSAFTVDNIGIVAFSLDSLASTEFVHHRYTPSPPVFNSVTGYQYTNHTMSNVVNWNTGAGTWLAVAGIRYAPRAPFGTGGWGAPVWQAAYSDDGSWTGTLSPITHRDVGCGMVARSSLTNTSTAYFRHATGGFRVLTSIDTAGQFGLRGFDTGNTRTANEVTQLDEFEVFALRVDSGATYGGLGNFQYLQKNDSKAPAGTPPATLASIFGDGNTYEVSEMIAQTNAPLTDVYVQGAYRLPRSDAGFTPSISTNKGNGVRAFFFSDSIAALAEGVLQRMGTTAAPLQRGGPSEVQLRFTFVQDQGETAVAFNDGMDFLAIGWNKDNEANATPIATPITPAAIVLVPNSESPAVGDLNVLPNDAAGVQMRPTVARQETPDVPRHSLLSDDETRLTWPKFMVARREWTVTWPGLTRADRDTLLDFLNTQSNRVFAWTPPRTGSHGETAIAVLCAEGPTSSDRQLLHDVSARLVELVFTDDDRVVYFSQSPATALGSAGSLVITLVLPDNAAEVAHHYASVEFYSDADATAVATPTSGTIAYTVKTVVLPGSFEDFTGNTIDIATDGLVDVDWSSPTTVLRAEITTAAGGGVAYARLSAKGMEN